MEAAADAVAFIFCAPIRIRQPSTAGQDNAEVTELGPALGTLPLLGGRGTSPGDPDYSLAVQRWARYAGSVQLLLQIYVLNILNGQAQKLCA